MKILIADDNLFYRTALGGTMREWGYEVIEASDGVAALEILQSDNAPKLAVVDWMMPKLDGLEVCRRLRVLQKPEPTYILMLTSKSGKENIVTALESGADDYLTKPFDRNELNARLRVGRRIVGLQTSQTVMFAFARAAEAKSPYTHGHSDRVAKYALALAQHLQLSSSECEVLHRGALLHDIGKISIPDSILNKPGKLTPEEFALMKQHPDQGVKIVERLESLQDVVPLIRWHHERMDGRGYPDGLRAGELPLLVRILSVADIYDALASDRPYRAILPFEQCMKILREEAAGGGLEPELVRCFIEIAAQKFVPAVAEPPRPAKNALFHKMEGVVPVH